MVSPAKRRAVRVCRFLQTYPLWYAGAAAVGLLLGAAGWIAGAPSWLRWGVWLVVPFVLFLANLAFLLAISAVANLGVLVWTLARRPRG